MFCPSCGTEATLGLNYCNRCGMNLGVLTSQPQIIEVNLTKPTLILGIVLTVLTLGGFGSLLGAAMALSTVTRGDDFLAVPVFGMMFICLIDILLIRQLSKLINASLKSRAHEPAGISAKPQTAPQLSRHATAQLASVPSVTEHTTRFFDPVYREPATPPTRNDPEK